MNPVQNLFIACLWVAVGLLAKHLLQHYQISTCLQVERKVQRLISQIWKHEVVALKAVPLKCNYRSMGAIVENHFTRASQSGGAVKRVGSCGGVDQSRSKDGLKEF